MDLKKSGKFIQEMRKKKNLTQVQLAVKLGVSEKTISKWECGNGFPDTTLMLPLCKELGISANELLSAKELPSEKDYKDNAEKNLLVLKAQNEKNYKIGFWAEVAIIFLVVAFLLSVSAIAGLLDEVLDVHPVWLVLLMVGALIVVMFGVIVSIMIETKVGFYKCSKCNHKYVPSYKQTWWAMHRGRTRYMKCPKCGKYSWQHKSINGDDEEV